MPLGGRASAATWVQKSYCFPNGISDAEGERAYIRNSAGGIDSIDLKTGKLLWTTPAASVPLIISGVHLLAFKYISENVIQIVKLNSKTGLAATTSEPINFPEGMKVASTQDETFALEPKVIDTILEIAWRGRTFYEGGAPPPKHIREKSQQQFSGVFQVDLATGTVTSKSVDDLADSLEAPKSPLTTLDTVDWKIEDHVVTLSSKREQQGQVLFMKPAHAKLTKLFSGPNLVTNITADGLYLLIRSMDFAPTTWHLFSAETGREIRTVPYETGAQQPCVSADRLFYLAPDVKTEKARVIALKAVDLHSGRVLWSREMKETGGGSRPLPPVVHPPIN